MEEVQHELWMCEGRMLRELSQWGVRCFSSFETGTEIPEQLLQLIRSWLADKTHHWAHFGGVIDPGCVKTSPRKRKRFEKALVVAAELSARLVLLPLSRNSSTKFNLPWVWLHGLRGRSDKNSTLECCFV